MATDAVVRLNGGLGNQLFQVHLALFLTLQGWTATVEGSASVIAHDQVGIQALKMPLPIRGIGHLARLPVGTRKVKRAIQTQVYRVTRQRLDDDWVRRLLNQEVTPTPGRYVFSGDFQFAGIVEYVRNTYSSMRYPELLSPTNWFLETARGLKQSQPWAVHVRRGDFTSRNGFLSLDYYSRAIARLGVAPDEPGVLFSDDPVAALAFLRPLGFPITAVSPPPLSPAAESMLLMASCRQLVCSNSTFSWWAARWSEGVSVLPEEFFPSGSFRDSHLRAKELRFSGALRIPSAWCSLT